MLLVCFIPVSMKAEMDMPGSLYTPYPPRPYFRGAICENPFWGGGPARGHHRPPPPSSFAEHREAWWNQKYVSAFWVDLQFARKDEVECIQSEVGVAGTARGGTGHLGLTHTETQRGKLWTACGQRRLGSKHSQTTPATTSASSIHQLLGATAAQTAHHATFSTAPTHQLLGSANAETTPARAAAGRKQRPDATCEGKNG